MKLDKLNRLILESEKNPDSEEAQELKRELKDARSFHDSKVPPSAILLCAKISKNLGRVEYYWMDEGLFYITENERQFDKEMEKLQKKRKKKRYSERFAG